MTEAATPESSEPVTLVLVNGFNGASSGGPGGVGLLFEAVEEAACDRGLDVRAGATIDVISELRRRGPVLIFTQQEGHLSAGYRSWAEQCLDAGAVIVEKNVFALASAHRPRHPRYVLALMSMDGAHRYVWRSAASGRRPLESFLLLPNPLLQEPVFVDGASVGDCSDQTVLRLLRIGRPDRVKWSDWEQRLAGAMVQARPDVRIHLTLVGIPESCMVPERDLPPGVQVFPGPAVPREYVGTAYAAADAYVHYSRIGETFGNTLAEAQTAGCFCVAAFRAEWDCAPIEFLEPATSWVSSPRRALSSAGELVDAIRRHRSQPRSTSLLTPSAHLSRILGVLTDQSAVQRLPSTSEALRYLATTGRSLDGVKGAVSGPVLAGARSAKWRVHR